MQAQNKRTMLAASATKLGFCPGNPNFVDSTRRWSAYTGVSDCSRSGRWKPGRPGDFMEGRIPPSAKIERWDGRAKACAPWDNLRRDPELWFDGANCLVHLYGKGQSRRGPAFRVPLRSLLEANCHPLLSRYLLSNLPESGSPGSCGDLWSGPDGAGTVELYIPPPPMANKKQILDFYLAMRNLFAWVYRRPMVGEHLGSALITLVHSMREFRSPGVDKVEDVMGYLQQEGYLDMANQPIHALAVVHLAEYCQLNDLYINSFAHCAGMSDYLYGQPEYQEITSITRKLLRQAQASVEAKLSSAAMSLRSFLEDDLCESDVGLTAGGRAHLERFRTFLLAFYAHRLGYYPPSPIRTSSGMWDPEIYCVMRADFAALYEFLADRTSTAADSASSFRGRGGVCALQSVHAFDVRHRYSPLPHPLPRLPEMPPSAAPRRRMSWFGRAEDKLRPDRRLIAHAALVKATNSDAPHLARNPLVAAYKAFEEDLLCSQLRFDRIEKLSQADLRTIRWILVYGAYQTLRSCTDAPTEVTDTAGVGYSLAIPKTGLPPWKEEGGRHPSLLLRRMRSKTSTRSPVPSVPPSGASTPVGSETRPDVDYFALPRPDGRIAASPGSAPPFEIPPRAGSLSGVPPRTGTRKSPASPGDETCAAPAIEALGPRANAAHGYENGISEAHVGSEGSGRNVPRPGLLASRSPSSSSSSSAGSSDSASAASPRSEESWDSAHTSIADAYPAELDKTLNSTPMPSSVCSTPDEPPCPPVPRRNSKRMSRAMLSQDAPAPLQIRKGCEPMLYVDDMTASGGLSGPR